MYDVYELCLSLCLSLGEDFSPLCEALRLHLLACLDISCYLISFITVGLGGRQNETQGVKVGPIQIQADMMTDFRRLTMGAKTRPTMQPHRYMSSPLFFPSPAGMSVWE